MKKYLFFTAVMMVICSTSKAQTLATNYKGTGYNNPISANIFCAEPTALEYNGRLYVYGSNDHQEFVANDKQGDNTCGNIKSIVVFSTDDMVNWTFHGTIDTKKLCASWVTNPWYKGYGVSWAPSVTWRHNESTDKDEFFLYFCNSSHGVGVLTAESPIGPWTSPLTELMIDYDTPGANPLETNANFDPGVVIDENGDGWITFGGLGSSTIMPEAARIVKLKPSMTEVDGTAVKIQAPYHFEANELNFIGGKYVFTYCSHWDRDAAEWNTYKTEHNISAEMPGGGTMCYMVSDNPLDPDSWIYKDYYGPGVGGNNHSHLQKFKGNYYHIYHDNGSVLLDAMKSAGAVDASAGDYRSICVNQATVNESTATINRVTLSREGVTQIKNLNPYEWQQAETMACCGGVDYEDFNNIEQNTIVSTLGNDASENMMVKMKAGSWINVRRIDYGDGATKFRLRAKGTGTVELRNGFSSNTVVATIEFSSSEMEEQAFDVPASKLYGVKNNLYIVVTDASDFYIDAWQFSNLPEESADDSGSCGENVTYTFVEETGTLTISGTGAMTDYTHDSSAPWYSYRNAIKTVVVTDGVTSIGNYAFRGCSGLTSVTIPNSVTSIGNYAFYNCSGLTSVTIPNSVTSIGDLAFEGCSGLTSVIIPNSVTSIGDLAFEGCSGLTSITIPNSVTSIGQSAFGGCSGLTSVIIPNSVTSIGRSAFVGCIGLTSVTVESGNTVYDSRENCNAIIKTSTNELVAGCKNTVIPNSVTSIGSYAFEGCSGLTSITIPGSVTSIGQGAFYGCSGLTSITVESGNTVYDSRENCNAIIKTSTNELITGCKNTVIPNSVTSIGLGAFKGCSGLTSVTIPNSVTSIGQAAFYGCSGLTSVTIPNSVTSIGDLAFYYCSGLTSVTIPNSVTSIGNYAFYCSGLTSVTCLAENVPTTESNAFDSYYIQNATLLVPAGSVAAYQAAAPWSGFGQITDQTDISQIDNVIYIEPFEARPGRTEREVSIKMKNSAAIRGFQFDLVLPEGVTPVTSGTSIFRKLNNNRFPKDDFDERYHTLNISLQSDGSYRFLCGSTQDQTLIGNDGEIILLKVNVDENQAERDYPIILKNIRLTESDINNYYDIDVLLSKMTVLNYMIGDINGDNAVNVSDYIGVANHILGNTPNGFNAVTADVNEDNAIDVSDYIGIANIILTGSIYGNSNNAAPAFEEDAEFDPQ